MKKIKKILFMCFLSIISITTVYAKDTIMTCEYYKAADELSPYPGNQQVGVLCNIYSDYSHQCYLEVGSNSATTSSNKETIENWGSAIGLSWKAKDYVKNNNKCPDYLLIRLKSGAIFNAGGYEIHAAENMTDLMALQGKLSGQRYPATLKGMQIAEDRKKKAEEEVKSYTEMISGTISNYSINTCAEKENIITKYTKCKSIISNLKSNISTWNTNVLNYINQGYFTEEDQIIKDYRATVKVAEAFFTNAEKELEEKNKEIKEELGLIEKEEGNNVNIRFCNDKNVKKTLRFIGTLLVIAKILVPILLIVFGVMDFSKAVIASDNDSISKASKNLILRIIAGIVIFLLPTIINFIFSGVVKNNSGYNQCRACIFERKC